MPERKVCCVSVLSGWELDRPVCRASGRFRRDAPVHGRQHSPDGHSTSVPAGESASPASSADCAAAQPTVWGLLRVWLLLPHALPRWLPALPGPTDATHRCPVCSTRTGMYRSSSGHPLVRPDSLTLIRAYLCSLVCQVPPVPLPPVPPPPPSQCCYRWGICSPRFCPLPPSTTTPPPPPPPPPPCSGWWCWFG